MSDSDPKSHFAHLPWPTLGGKQVWADVFLYAGWRIQQNVLSEQHRLLDPWDVRHAAGNWRHCHDTFLRLRASNAFGWKSDHMVLLIHGYFRSKDSFGGMTHALRQSGYEAQGINYPSTRQTVSDHASQIETLLNRIEGIRTLSIISHSMGGIISRILLSRPDAPWRQRIAFHRLVMIGTPNQGARMASHVGDVPGAHTLVGPSMSEITPEAAAKLPIPDVRFGTVAGTRGDGRGYNPLLTGEDDMTVTARSARLTGSEDHLDVPGGLHTFIMVDPRVVKASLHYLRTGQFQPKTSA